MILVGILVGQAAGLPHIARCASPQWMQSHTRCSADKALGNGIRGRTIMVQILIVEFVQYRVQKNRLVVDGDHRIRGYRHPVIFDRVI